MPDRIARWDYGEFRAYNPEQHRIEIRTEFLVEKKAPDYFDFNPGTCPPDYVCNYCGRTGKKLWKHRLIHPDAGSDDLACTFCAMQIANIPPEFYTDVVSCDANVNIEDNIGLFYPAFPSNRIGRFYTKFDFSAEGPSRKSEKWWESLRD